MTQTLEQNRIESLRRTIKEKRRALGVEGNLLDWKGFKRFADLDVITYPESLHKYRYHLYLGKTETFNEDYPENLTIGKHRHLYERLVDEVSKYLVQTFQTQEEVSTDEIIEQLHAFIYNDTCFSPSMTLEEATDTPEGNYVKRLIHWKTKKEISTVYRFTFTPYEGESRVAFTTFDLRIPNKLEARWSNKITGEKAEIFNLAKLLAKASLIHLSAKHLLSSELVFDRILDQLELHATFNRDRLRQFNYHDFILHFLANNMHSIDLIRSLIVLTFSDLIRDYADLQGIEKRFIQRSSTHATAYMTKKNIPLKIQNFMKDNHFLAMFGEVEADELCDLEKLNQLAEEFVTLSKQLPLPQAKDHTLRFRRLGRHKAAGLYYPFYQTLAVDIDSPRSFIHEWFHLIDFEHQLLSADAEFRPLLQLYRQTLDEGFRALGSEDPTYKKWFGGSSKYSRAYYLSSEEAFARLGECYVANFLGIQSSFNARDLTSTFQQLVYPSTPELNEAIQSYFEPLFKRLQSSESIVTFETSPHSEELTVVESPSPTKRSTERPIHAVAMSSPSSKVWEPESVQVIEQLSLGI